MAKFRPFTVNAGLRDGTWGHQVIADLPRPDYEFRKWAYSAFHRTELDHMLSALGIDHLILVGIATNIAIESSGITLVKGDLRGIERARRLSLATLKNIKQNLAFAFVYNALGIPIAAGVFYPVFHLLLSPMIASAAMTFSDLSVVFNALRLRRVKI